MQTKTFKVSKKCASTPKYISPNQLTLAGFETPFAQKLTSNNRWIKMADAIPWDKIIVHYDNLFKSAEGRPPISGRVIFGAIIIKHIESLPKIILSFILWKMRLNINNSVCLKTETEQKK